MPVKSEPAKLFSSRGLWFKASVCWCSAGWHEVLQKVPRSPSDGAQSWATAWLGLGGSEQAACRTAPSLGMADFHRPLSRLLGRSPAELLTFW